MEKKEKKKYTWIMLAALAVVVVIAAVALSSGNEPQEVTTSSESEYVVTVETASVTRQNLASYLETVGELKAGETAAVAPKTGGRVSSVAVKLGDRVSAGQVLVTLDSTDALHTIANNEAALVVAGTNVELSQQSLSDAEQSFERTSQLFAAKAVSQTEYDKAESELNNARLNLEVKQGQLRQAEITLANAREDLANYTVVAPISGEVAAVNIHAGEMASAQVAVINLVSLSTMKVNVNVSENIVSNMRPGAEVPVVISALNREISGSISSISPSIDNTSKAFPVEISVSNPQGDMKEGMVVRLKLLSGTADNVLALPTDAVLEKDGLKYVFVLEDDTAQEMPVSTGLMSDALSEVTTGLQEGQTVITSGNQLVKDGQKVRLSEGTESTREDNINENS